MRPLRRVSALALVAPLALTHCEWDRDRSPPPDRPAALPKDNLPHTLRALGIDAGDLEAKVDPPAPAGDLKSDLDSFTTIDACVESRSRKVEPLVGDAMEAIGYDTLLSDACRVLDAAKAKDSRRCRAIDTSPLRDRCAVTVAEVAGDANECPWEIAGRPAEGRNPACLAIASGDGRLCSGAVVEVERATCAALVGHRPGACSELDARSDRVRCVRDVERWRALLSDRHRSAQREEPEAKGKLHVGATDSESSFEIDMGPDLARGVVLRETEGGVLFAVGSGGSPPGSAPDLVAPSPHVRAAMTLELFVPALKLAGGDAGSRIDPGRTRIERAELLLPGHAPIVAARTLNVRSIEIDARRGGTIVLVVEGHLTDAREADPVHGEFSTFVRDVVSAAVTPDDAVRSPLN